MGDTPYLISAGYLVIDGVTLRNVQSVTPSVSPNDVTCKATWARGKVKIFGIPEYTYTIKMSDNDTHDELLAIQAIAAAQQAGGAAVAVTYGPRGSTAGRLRYSGNAYVSDPATPSGGVEAEGEFEFQVSFSSKPTISLMLSLAGQTLTAVARGAVYSGVNLVASGGTATYTYVVCKKDGTATGAGLPQGLSISSGGVVSGTCSASETIGTHPFYVKVTDSATPAVVQVFECTIAVTA